MTEVMEEVNQPQNWLKTNIDWDITEQEIFHYDWPREFSATFYEKNYKQLQKIGQYSLKCHNHSPIFITNFSQSDQHLAPVLSCQFLPVRLRRSNNNNFHQQEISFLDESQTKELNHFLTLEMSSRRHKKLHRSIISWDKIYRSTVNLIEDISIVFLQHIWLQFVREKSSVKFALFMQSKCVYRILSFHDKSIDSDED